MRILTYLQWLEASGGAEQSVFQLARELAARGHQVDLAYAQDGNLSEEFGSFCHRLIRTPQIRYSSTPLAQLPDILKAVWRVRRSAPDVIYVNNVSELAWAAAVRAVAGGAIVCHLRDVGAWRPISVKTLGRTASRYVANSDFTGSRWAQQGLPADRIEVVPNAVPLDVYSPGSEIDRDSSRRLLGLPHEAFVVIYMGRLVRLKGVEVLLDAWRLLGYAPERARLLIFGGEHGKIAGDAGYADALQSNSPAGVEWHSMVSDVPSVLRAADAMVLPSVRDEAFGRAIIEAMATGVPAVASAVGGIPEVLGGEFARMLFPAGDAEALAERLGSLADWRREDPELGVRCRAYVARRFSLPESVDRMEAVFRAASTR